MWRARRPIKNWSSVTAGGLTQFFATLVISITAAGCGYWSSGEWIDDAGNWNRAFHSTKPDDVGVVHSLYWRAPHWTFEAGYLFEIAPNEALKKQLFAENELRRVAAADLDDGERPCFGECPSWFVPGPLGDYDVWQYADDPNSKFRLFIDKKSGRMFLGDFVV